MLLIFFIGVPLALFIVILIAFFILQKTKAASKSAVLQKMRDEAKKGTSGGSDIFYQKIYMKIDRVPILNRYLRKIRRRMELVNTDDEYKIRKDTARITLKSIFIALIASIAIAWINKENLFIMIVSLLGVLIVVENLTEQMVNKVENRLLVQELEFFSEVRHAFHGTSMVEEAIYDASLIEDQEIVSQANIIYEILVSAEPEIELEKYYDVAPNRFLKIFAGVSYLTKEFGDRKIQGVSLYLKDMNNITQELQLEILKRDKLDYLFKSLTYIAVAPILLIHPLKNWAIGSFASTAKFYEGPGGFLSEILLIALIFLSYSLLVRIKDNNDKQSTYTTNEAWQEKVYRLPFVEKIIDGLVPSQDKPAYASINKLLQDTASTLKIEWLYVNRVICAVIAFFVALLIVNQMHAMAVENVLYSDTVENNIMGKASDKEIKAAQSMSASDRFFLSNLLDSKEIVNAVRKLPKEQAIEAIRTQMEILNIMPLSDEKAEEMTQKIWKHLNAGALNTEAKRRLALAEANLGDAILRAGIEMPRDEFVTELTSEIIKLARETNTGYIEREHIYEAVQNIYSIELTSDQIYENSERIYTKLKDLSSEYFKWTELLLAMFIGLIAYQVPKIFLSFQKKMRQMDMDDEVMQFQTIILMLMHIERVSVEYILEWITRFSVIFKEPLQRCVNNYESGAYEALEQLKDEVTFKPFIRIVESLQSAVENVKITDAFDELESERAFFQEKRKEANERLINRKAKLGRLIGFAPMVTLFVGYLIVPLMWSSMADMGTYFTQMSSML